MKKRILAGIIILAVLCVAIGILCDSMTSVAGQKANSYTKEELTQLINDNQYIKENAHIMAESARALGWEDDDKLIIQLQETWNEANKNEIKYQTNLDNILAIEAEEQRRAEEARRIAEENARKIEEAKWANKAAEYPVATQIWRYMKAQGWNDYVCAGIMGNIMAEVGGQTLNIRYTLSSGSYYGMCQWSRGYSQVWGAGLETQCDFLRDTIKYEFDTYGNKYQKGFNFNSFLNMTDAQQAALAFAKSYERCGSGSYSVRQKNALKAYNYFVG